jgi:DNA-binding CsgD family transcriptional regulator
MRLATLIRLNLSSEELVLIFNISAASLMTKRYRLRKKLNLKKNESLEYVIVSI